MTRRSVARPCVGGGVDREHTEIDRSLAEWTSLVEAGEQEEVVDQRAHSQRLGLGTAHRLLQRLSLLETTAPVELHVAPDGRDGRAQLVRGVGDELSQSCLRGGSLVECFLDAGQHRVDHVAELACLRALVSDGYTVGKVAAAIAVAVAVICFTGRTPRRITHHATTPRRPSTSPVMITSDPDEPAHRSVDIGERERCDVRLAAGLTRLARTRYRVSDGGSVPTVNGSFVGIAGAVDDLIDLDGRRRRVGAGVERRRVEDHLVVLDPADVERRVLGRGTLAHGTGAARRSAAAVDAPPWTVCWAAPSCTSTRSTRYDSVLHVMTTAATTRTTPTTDMPTRSHARRDIVGRQLARRV